MTDDAPTDTDATEPAPDKRTVVSVQLSPEDYARVVRHHARMQAAQPMQPIKPSFATREAIHRGLDAMDAEVLAAEVEQLAAANRAANAALAAKKGKGRK